MRFFRSKPKPCSLRHNKRDLKALYDPETKQKYPGQYVCPKCGRLCIIPGETIANKRY